MLKNMKLGTKLLLAFLAVGVIPFLVIGLTSMIKASGALSTQAFNQLESVRAIKTAQIEKFFRERQGDMGVLIKTVGMLRREAFAKLRAVQDLKRNSLKVYFQDKFKLMGDVQGNLRFTQGVVLFTNAFASGLNSQEYKSLLTRREAGLRKFQQTFGFYNVFLIDPKGNVVYTVAKESALGVNLTQGSLSNSGLAKAFKQSRNGITMVDLAWYGPSNQPAAFFAVPLKDKSGKYTGSAAFQISLKAINAIMMERSGMGKTGESYLVGQDNLMRSDSFLDNKGHSVAASFKNNNKVETEAASGALAGKSGEKVIIDYNGNPVLSVWNTFEPGSGIRWAIISEIDVAEAFSPVNENGEEYYKSYVDLYGYYDLFLMNPDGYIFYTVARESDYQTNMVNGKFSGTNLGKLTRKVLESKKYVFADFAPYEPSNGEPAAFLAQPVINNGQVELIVALQLSLDAINDIMQERQGMGRTGETYLVGSDRLMRSDSFLDPINHSVKASFANPSLGKVDTEATRNALSGQTGTKIIIDYNGNSVLSAYNPIKVGDTTWSLIAEIDEAEAFEAINSLKWMIIVVGLIGIAVIVVVAMMITRSITKPVAAAVNMIQEMGQGHLNNRLQMNRGDEIGQMAQAMDDFADGLQNEFVAALQKLSEGDLTFDAKPKDDLDVIGNALVKTREDLNEVMGQIQVAAEQMASGSGQVSDASQSLSQGATESASSLEEITSSMTQMGSQTKTNAENATQANSLATEARDAAEKGSGQMEEMITAMGEINDASQSINKIIKVIDEIAFQTNLLALNAAVEAARAGRHGKGFAVVAEEVRNLAARSAKAAKETSDLIENSIKKSEKGGEIAARTNEALGGIVGSITKVTDLVGEINAASNEQAQGIAQINQGLNQIDQVTQQNTANAEESAAAAEELSSQANHLKQLLMGFKLLDGGHSTGGSRHARILGQSKALGSQKNEKTLPPAAHDADWGGANLDANGKKPALTQPKEVISLDDNDFGKY